jgi:hypothetical protein
MSEREYVFRPKSVTWKNLKCMKNAAIVVEIPN